LITAAILAVPFGVWWIWDRSRTTRTARAAQARQLAAQRRRDDLESRATVDVAGGCGWCGLRIAHRDERGGLVTPVDYHRSEIDEQLASDPLP
jgi:hypothetical protein